MNAKMPVAGVKVKTGVKGGRLSSNHNGPGLRVKSGLKAGKISANHNGALRVTRACTRVPDPPTKGRMEWVPAPPRGRCRSWTADGVAANRPTEAARRARTAPSVAVRRRSSRVGGAGGDDAGAAPFVSRLLGGLDVRAAGVDGRLAHVVSGGGRLAGASVGDRRARGGRHRTQRLETHAAGVLRVLAGGRRFVPPFVTAAGLATSAAGAGPDAAVRPGHHAGLIDRLLAGLAGALHVGQRRRHGSLARRARGRAVVGAARAARGHDAAHAAVAVARTMTAGGLHRRAVRLIRSEVRLDR